MGWKKHQSTGCMQGTVALNQIQFYDQNELSRDIWRASIPILGLFLVLFKGFRSSKFAVTNSKGDLLIPVIGGTQNFTVTSSFCASILWDLAKTGFRSDLFRDWLGKWVAKQGLNGAVELDTSREVSGLRSSEPRFHKATLLNCVQFYIKPGKSLLFCARNRKCKAEQVPNEVIDVTIPVDMYCRHVEK